MSSERNHEFLNLYKMIEDTLEERYIRQGRRYSSVIMEFINSPEGDMWREKMDMCREIRNLMTHTADFGDEAVITPAQGVVDVLREIYEYLQKPPMAISYATHFDQLLKASPMDPVLPLMRAMSRRGFSHVPVMRGDSMVGVFSVSTIFSNVLEGNGRITQEMRVRDFDELLSIENHMAEQFAFISDQATLPEAQAMFDRREKKRMAALFVTKDGLETGKLMGMITPWDVLRRK